MEPSGQLRAAAADTLGRMGTAAASFAAQVAALLKDSTPEVRSAALYALGHMVAAGAGLAPRVHSWKCTRALAGHDASRECGSPSSIRPPTAGSSERFQQPQRTSALSPARGLPDTHPHQAQMSVLQVRCETAARQPCKQGPANAIGWP